MKSNVDCEVYISGFISFFEKNPKDLNTLIGNVDKEKFFMEIRIAVYQNFDNGEELTLTQKQLLDILVKLHKNSQEVKEQIIPWFKTKYGDFILN